MAFAELALAFGFLISTAWLRGGFDPVATVLSRVWRRFDAVVTASDASSGAFFHDVGMTLRCGLGRDLRWVS